jgi:hypothetical protein
VNVTSENFPAAFAAMDQTAKECWAYPSPEWQESFLHQWASDHGDELLKKALEEEIER